MNDGPDENTYLIYTITSSKLVVVAITLPCIVLAQVSPLRKRKRQMLKMMIDPSVVIRRRIQRRTLCYSKNPKSHN